MKASSIIVSVVIVAILSEVASAQQVIVKEKPGEGQWTISYSRKHAPEVFELRAGCKTLAAAKAEAQKLIAWSSSMQANSSWRLAVIEIEGEDAQAPKADGPKLPGFVELSNDFRAALNETATVLEEYMGQIAGAYERAKQAKEGLLKMQGDVTKDVFDKVNGTIADYNNQLDTAQSSPKGASFARFPRMTPVGPEVLKKADDWRKAKEDQFALEEKKEGLDRDNVRLATERQRLIEEGREIKSEEERIASLRLSMQKGPYRARPRGDIIIPGKYNFLENAGGKSFSTYEEALGFLKDIGFLPPDRATITDASGNPVNNPPSDDGEAALKVREQSLVMKKSEREAKIKRYKADLESYDSELKEYDSATRAHKSRIDDLSKVTYNAPTGPKTAAPSRPAATSSSANEEVRDGVRYRRWTDGRMYPVAPDHSKLPNYNGPRWVGNNLVSP